MVKTKGKISILITGGNGFLGKDLAEKLAKNKKYNILVFSRHREQTPANDANQRRTASIHLGPNTQSVNTRSDVKSVAGDITSKEDLEKCFQTNDIDTVYHLAASTDELDKEMWQVNVNGTRNVVEFCKKYNVKQLVFMSSSGVLGETKEPATEDMPYKPKTDYEWSKKQSELVVKEFPNYTIIRAPIIIGPNDIWMKIIGAAKQQYPLIGSGKNYFHLAYIDDVVDILTIVLNNKKALGQVFHVATKDTPTYKEVYQMICDELKTQMPDKKMPVKLVKFMASLHEASSKAKGKKPKLTMMKSSIDRLVRNRIISTQKAEDLLNFRPKYSTKEAIHETIKYLAMKRLGYDKVEKSGMEVEKYIKNKIAQDGGIISVVIDPVDYPTLEKAVETGITAYKAGVDLIAVGGSIGAQGRLLDEVVQKVKEKVDIPVILFPGNIATITPYADAIYFMTLLNSRNPYWISQAQTLAAPLIKKLGIEALPVGYIVIEPGGTVGWVGDSNNVPRNKPQIAAALALAGQMAGKRIIFTDAGSAAYAPVPTDMVKTVKRAIDVPYLVAGGIKTPKQAYEIIKAGADWIQIGTAAEQSKNTEKLLKEFVSAVKKAGKAKIK